MESRHAHTERNCMFGLPGVGDFQVLAKSGHNLGLTVVPGLDRQDCEFIPAQAGDNIGISKGVLQDFSSALQRLVAFGMTKGIVNLLQPVDVDEEHEHFTAGSAPEFQLTFRKSLKAAAIIKASQVILKRQIAEFCLQHVLLRCAANCAHEKFTEQLILGAPGTCALLPADISQQTGELLIHFRKQSLKGPSDRCLFSAMLQTLDTTVKRSLRVNRDPQDRSIRTSVRGVRDFRRLLHETHELVRFSL